MADEPTRRVEDGWNRDEKLVLKTLEDLRMSTDASLKMAGEIKDASFKMSGELKAEFASLRAEVKGSLENQQRQIDELKKRFDDAIKWAAGIAASVIVGVFIYLLNQLHMVAK